MSLTIPDMNASSGLPACPSLAADFDLLTSNRRSLRRRDVLTIGSLTALGISLGPAFGCTMPVAAASADEPPPPHKPAKRCVLIWLDGGPSHLETLDPKPDASREVRGPLDSIQTGIPGISLSECLPGIATRLSRFAIIRSMTSPLGEHNFGTHYLLTGYRPTPVVEYPSFCSAAAFVRNAKSVLPSQIAVPDFRVGGGRFSGNGFLDTRFAPFSVGSDPAKPDFVVRNLTPPNGLDSVRLDRRRQFLNQLDEFRRRTDAVSPGRKTNVATTTGYLPGSSDSVEQAWELISSPQFRTALDLEQESPESRNRYGRRTVGQSCLLARRLIERGVPFITVNHHGWDTHTDLYTRLKEGFTGAKTPVGLIPALDQAVAALTDDLSLRGLLDETLIVIMGEFGRTPKLNTQGGRDHWPRVFSVALAGGGIRGGQIIGASDRNGESPDERPVTPGDLTATIYSRLGITPETTIHTSDGRPVRLAPADSSVISELT
ncbi:DUF1501 domain-containing protein [bacterium]|nr:DUF1501 domain-containing protein [bacterium]